MEYLTRGRAARLARVAHNHKVAGSNPAPATKIKSSPFGGCFILGNSLHNIFADFPAN